MAITKQQALDYHFGQRPGKIEVAASKPCRTQRDLSLAYTPGVAVPCLEIEKNPHDAFKYTARGNLVAVVSNGTAVLGLGDIGALAGKPVMEGKGVLFKRFADVDVFDLEVEQPRSGRSHQAMPIARAHIRRASTWRTSRRRSAFTSKRRCKKTMKIPVFHDDQHGTAIISGAALLNALEVAGKPIDQVQGRFQRRGRIGNRVCRTLRAPGREARKHHSVRHQGRGLQGPYRGHESVQGALRARRPTCARWPTRCEGADVFVGCSVKGAVNAEMIAIDGGAADRVCDGESGPGDHATKKRKRAATT